MVEKKTTARASATEASKREETAEQPTLIEFLKRYRFGKVGLFVSFIAGGMVPPLFLMWNAEFRRALCGFFGEAFGLTGDLLEGGMDATKEIWKEIWNRMFPHLRDAVEVVYEGGILAFRWIRPEAIILRGRMRLYIAVNWLVAPLAILLVSLTGLLKPVQPWVALGLTVLMLGWALFVLSRSRLLLLAAVLGFAFKREAATKITRGLLGVFVLWVVWAWIISMAPIHEARALVPPLLFALVIVVLGVFLNPALASRHVRFFVRASLYVSYVLLLALLVLPRTFLAAMGVPHGFDERNAEKIRTWVEAPSSIGGSSLPGFLTDAGSIAAAIVFFGFAAGGVMIAVRKKLDGERRGGSVIWGMILVASGVLLASWIRTWN